VYRSYRARLYKTGDLARYLPDGNIEFLGRLDHQVKLRGFRIELGEVETTLAQHPAVREVVVTVREDTPGDKRLVAYVVRAQEQFPSPSELRRFLQTKLPEYMVPAAFLVLDALPLNPNGKVDRQALPPPSQAATELERPFVAPRDRLEYQLAKLWEKILGIQMVSVNDNFFDLGGHSLLAVRLLAQIEKISGKDLALVTIFQAPTVEQMAAVLRQHGWSTPQSLLLPFQAGGFQPPFFCVHGYGELWRYVGSDQPFYAFHPHGLDGYRAPATVEEMAADYLKEVQALQTEGPYFLGGFSFGGLIVFEMAQQLRKQGKEVALLVLFDPTKPSNGTPFSAMNPSQRVKWLARKITHKICRLYLSLGRRLPPPLRLSYFLGVARQAAQKYRPQMYWGRTLLFKTKTLPFDPRFDWNHLVTGGVEAHEILGTHLDIFREPHVQSWAEYFVDALRQAQVLAIDTHRAAVVGGSCPPPPCRR
jgi:thioesterase domain-containing protein/aryl carrier-like protein